MTTRRCLSRGALLLGLSVCTAPAWSWELLTKLARDGNGISGPSKISGSTRVDKSKSLEVQFNGGFPNESVPPGWPAAGSEIAGMAKADLASGAVHGFAHAVSSGGYTHEMDFAARVSDTVKLVIDSQSPSYQDWLNGKLWITVIGSAHGVATSTGLGQANLYYELLVNNARAAAATASDCVSYPTYCQGVWGNIDLDAPTRMTATLTSGGVSFAVKVLVPVSRQIQVVETLSGTAKAFSRVFPNSSGPGIADANASNTGWLQLVLPRGVSFNSDSGVLLTTPIPEPASWMLWLAGLALLGAWRRKA